MSKETKEYFNGDELAASVWESKYAKEGEVTANDMHKRLAEEFARVEKTYIDKENQMTKFGSKADISKYGQNRINLTKNEVYNLFKDFKYIIPQGSIMYGLGLGKPVSLSNCFVIDSAKDSYGGIMFTDQEQAQLMKRRGGVGHDLSNLRPVETVVDNAAGTSTGMASFMDRFSNTTREVAQNGRRGALMLSVDINHPDSLSFVKAKEDLTKVTGANISVKLNAEFMKAVENDEDYMLRFPCDKVNAWIKNGYSYNKLCPTTFSDGTEGYVKRIKAKKYFDEIIKQAHKNAEPGLMFWDNILNYSPDSVYEQYKPITSNPCGEQFLQAYDSCRLMCMNLFSFVDNPFTSEAYINYKNLYEVSYEQQRLADDLVDLEIEYIDRIIAKINNDEEPQYIKQVEIDLWKKIQDTAKKGRRTGCGITALADMLAALGLKYDSDEALEITDKVMKTKMEAELDCTIDLSILRGNFDGWDVKKETATFPDLGANPQNKFYDFIRSNFLFQYKKMNKHGRRNVSWSTIAPTGSVSILTQTSSGCEPVFMPYYTRRKKVNPNDKDVKVDFTDDNGDCWTEYFVLHEKFKDWLNLQNGKVWNFTKSFENFTKNELESWFKKSPWYNSTANDISWEQRLKMQEVLQKYTTNAISSTLNLPENTTEETVYQIYMKASKMGLKGVTVYREGSRSGVMIDSNKKEKESFNQTTAPKRPKELKGNAFITTVKGVKFNVIVGVLDDKPYEVFAFPSKILKGEGLIIKQGKSEYDFIQLTNSNSTHRVLTDDMSDEEATITRLVSTSLRHGTKIDFIVQQLNKTHGDLTSFSKAISRVLSKYAAIEKIGNCPECKVGTIIKQEGCESCSNKCGYSKC